MKKYIITTGKLLFATFLFFSCNDESLERYPLDRISNETFWNSENDLMVYNNSIYDLAKNDGNVPIMMGHDAGWYSTYYSIWYLDQFSDNIGSDRSRAFYQKVRSGKYIVPTNPGGQRYGYKGWNFVRAVNVGLANYSKASVAQSVIDKYAGEARLFRGWFYADKVSKFGNAPWVDHELNIDSEELFAKRMPREDVMAKVLEDLDFAVDHLPADWGDGNAPGRLNRWCALQVKSRVCLFEGTWQKYHGGTNPDMWLQEAAGAAKELIETGPYSLYVTGDPDHDYNAYQRAEDLTGNPEVLYWRRYQLGIVSHNVMSFHVRHNGGATKSMVEDYLCTDGLPITLSPLYMGDEVYENIFANRDPRLRQTILYPADQAYYNYDGELFYSYPRLVGMIGGTSTESGYHIIKVYDSSERFVSWNGCTSPAITLRLGEALLNYAEAKAELGTITQADLDMSINKLRDRVGMPHMDLSNIPVDPRYVNDGVSPLIVEIRRERRVELFMEGFRYDDLRRWKQGKKLEIPSYGMRWDAAAKAKYDPDGDVTMKTSLVDGVPYIDIYKGTDWADPVFDENKHYLWPIPLSVISQNNNIVQNPGW
ncbi:Cell surface glycan-binding lipoprotein, utilization system for glycans and polysaccharides (PUL), SusD family [hydrothermal vent metagenome]|uniref:Cell surface glycan-binding lipoprotein, utilization system for glycans and polysaccharides (PUL), SusD family n=1 Tax=hydrothermal vent metagenome TaxID=652676 RepID=A0A3B0TH60_9ZZZZ